MIYSDETIKRQTGGLVEKRPHLAALAPVELELMRTAPLPISYDVNRPQPWYFTEFSYTEFMGGVLVNAMTDEVAARLLVESCKHRSSFNVNEVIESRLHTLGTLDKYTLVPLGKAPKEVAILPGSNSLFTQTSRELLQRLVWERPKVMVKPHPLTNEQDLRRLRIDLGADRILPPKASGWEAIQHADRVYATSTTELAAYASWLGKRVDTIGNVFYERTGSYYPVFRMLVGRSGNSARRVLQSVLTSQRSGIVFVEDSAYPEKIAAYFDAAMKMRARFKPLVPGSFTYPAPPKGKEGA